MSNLTLSMRLKIVNFVSILSVANKQKYHCPFLSFSPSGVQKLVNVWGQLFDVMPPFIVLTLVFCLDAHLHSEIWWVPGAGALSVPPLHETTYSSFPLSPQQQ